MTAGYAITLGYFPRTQPKPSDPSGIGSYAFFRLSRLLPRNFFGSSLKAGMGSIVNASMRVTRI